MFHLRHTLSIIVFVFSCLGILCYSYLANFRDSIWDQLQNTSSKKSEIVSTFTHAKLYSSQENKPALFLDTDILSINHDQNKVFFQLPVGITFGKQGEEIHYRAALGHLDWQKNELGLEEDVLLDSDKSKISSKRLLYNLKSTKLVGTGGVEGNLFVPQTQDHLIISGDRLESSTSTQKGRFIGNVKGRVERLRRYEEGVNFSSQTLDFDVLAGRAWLKGDVNLYKENMHASARQGELWLENYNKKLKYFSLFSDVLVNETVVDKRGKTLQRRALSESLEWFVRDQLIVLSENPRVYQETDTIRGNRIILRENNSVIEVDDANSNFKVKKFGQ